MKNAILVSLLLSLLVCSPAHGKPTALDEVHVNALVQKAVGLQRAQRFKEALEVYNRGIKQYPTFSILWLSRGMLYKQLKDEQHANSDIKQAAKLAPGKSSTYQSLIQQPHGYVPANPSKESTWVGDFQTRKHH